jgi:hypothetical protein
VQERPCLQDVEEQVLGLSSSSALLAEPGLRRADEVYFDMNDTVVISCAGTGVQVLEAAVGCDDDPGECSTAVPLLHEVTGSSCHRGVLQCDSDDGSLDHSGAQQTESVSEIGDEGNYDQQTQLPDDQAALTFRTVVDFVAEQLEAACGGTWHSFNSLQDWLLLHGVACPGSWSRTLACLRKTCVY